MFSNVWKYSVVYSFVYSTDFLLYLLHIFESFFIFLIEWIIVISLNVPQRHIGGDVLEWRSGHIEWQWFVGQTTVFEIVAKKRRSTPRFIEIGCCLKISQIGIKNKKACISKIKTKSWISRKRKLDEIEILLQIK